MKSKFIIVIVIFLMIIVLILDLTILMTQNTTKSNKINLDMNSNNVENVVINSHDRELSNAIVTNIWIENRKLDEIKNNNIKYLIVDVGDTGDNGRLLTLKEDIDYFIKLIKDYEEKNNYNFILLPYSEINTDNYKLTPEFEDNFMDDYNELSKDFDGVFVDIEPIQLDMRENYVSLLKRLRNSMPNKIISVYSGSITEYSGNEWEWGIDFTKQVSEIVDLIVVQGYDTSLSTKEDYQDYIKSQVKIISSNEFKSDFFIGVPTHKDYPETLDNSLSSYTEEINKYPGSKLKGVSVFSEWTMNKNDWRTFERFFGFILLLK